MRYQPCDELAADLAVAQRDWGCTLQFPVAERLIEQVTERYPSRVSFETLLERALDLEFVLDENERHAYKQALGSFFNRRAQAARRRTKEMNAIPFAPR